MNFSYALIHTTTAMRSLLLYFITLKERAMEEAEEHEGWTRALLEDLGRI